MTDYDRHDTLVAERENVQAAIQRLLTGTAQSSSGRLNIVALADEAGIGRQALYERHSDLLAYFKVRAGHLPATPTSQALQGRLDKAHERITALETENTHLEQRVRTLAAIITEMSIEADGDNNVVPFPRN